MSKIKTNNELFEMLVAKNSTPDAARESIGYFCATESDSPYDTWDDFKEYLQKTNVNMYEVYKNEGYEHHSGEMIHSSNISFRYLRADEVEVRQLSSVQNNKINLLLYQDARCMMNILDETVGSLNWQKEYYEAKGLLFCKIGIRDTETGEWIWKADTGSKSNIEGDKGLSSDASKRAAVAWGIGRELYTAPKISVNLTEKDMYNGTFNQSFHVSIMDVSNGIITKLVIVDKWNNVRYTYSSNTTKAILSNEESPIETALAGDIPIFSSSSTPVVQMGITTSSANTKSLLEFCAQKREEEGINYTKLKSFEDFYQKPSKENPSINIADSISRFNPEYLWKKWK